MTCRTSTSLVVSSHDAVGTPWLTLTCESTGTLIQCRHRNARFDQSDQSNHSILAGQDQQRRIISTRANQIAQSMTNQSAEFFELRMRVRRRQGVIYNFIARSSSTENYKNMSSDSDCSDCSISSAPSPSPSPPRAKRHRPERTKRPTSKILESFATLSSEEER